MPEISLQTTQRTTQKTPRLVSMYVDMYEAFEDKDKVTKHEYRLILKYFNNLLKKSLIYDGAAYALPYGIGRLGISSLIKPRDSNMKVYDFQHYKETGEKRVIMNLNTEGRIMKVVLRAKPNQLFFNTYTRYLYKFKPARGLMRGIAKAIKEGLPANKYYSYETYFY